MAPSFERGRRPAIWLAGSPPSFGANGQRAGGRAAGNRSWVRSTGSRHSICAGGDRTGLFGDRRRSSGVWVVMLCVVLLGCHSGAEPNTVATSSSAPAGLAVSSRESSTPATEGPAAQVDAAPSALSVLPGSPPRRESESPVRTISLSPALCAEACENAMKITLAELEGAEAGAMREQIEKTMGSTCQIRCLERASLDSARCIAAARNALELADCP